MQKIIIPLIVCFFYSKANAQNVGIGTINPISNLEVKSQLNLL